MRFRNREDKEESEKIKEHYTCLVRKFKYTFLVFKQHYNYFYTFFHSYVFPKKQKTVI